jgi:hypothetical protein
LRAGLWLGNHLCLAALAGSNLGPAFLLANANANANANDNDNGNGNGNGNGKPAGKS